MDCIFCKIIAGEIPSDKVYEDEHVFAFRDINPQAPVHVLIVPKKHMRNILECDAQTAAAVTEAVGKVARQEGVSRLGFPRGDQLRPRWRAVGRTSALPPAGWGQAL